MNFIPWEFYTAFHANLVAFLLDYSKDHDNSQGKQICLCSSYLTWSRPRKTICSETYCQLQRTNRKPGPLSGVNVLLQLESIKWSLNIMTGDSGTFKQPDESCPHSESHWRSFKITITSTLDIYQTTNQTLPPGKVIQWKAINTVLLICHETSN